MSTAKTCRSILLMTAGILAGLLIAAGAQAEERDRAAPAQPRPGPERTAPDGSRIVLTTIFQATGARDGTTASTVVHCTNLEAGTRTVYVDFYDFDGTFACEVSADVLAGNTATFATRNTAIFVEDDSCDVAPDLNQGSLDILLLTYPSKVICTVEVLDPAAATPVYVTTLDLHRP